MAASKVRGIYNPVLIDDIYERAREPIDEPWLNDKQSPVIIGIGRYAYQKNFDMLIRAFALARKEVDCRLILVGEGPDKPLLESLIDELELRDSIKLVPVVTNPYPWYAHSDIYALSSNYEGLPTVVIEALALDCKLVSTDCMTGPREILEDGKLGTLVPVGDTEAFGKALVDAVRSNEKPQQAFNPEKFSVLAGVLRYCKLLDVPVPESEETQKTGETAVGRVADFRGDKRFRVMSFDVSPIASLIGAGKSTPPLATALVACSISSAFICSRIAWVF